MDSTDKIILERKNLDPASFVREEKKRARRTAMVLGSATIVSLIFLIFAFMQKSRVEELQNTIVERSRMVGELKVELQACQSKQ